MWKNTPRSLSSGKTMKIWAAEIEAKYLFIALDHIQAKKFVQSLQTSTNICIPMAIKHHLFFKLTLY